MFLSVLTFSREDLHGFFHREGGKAVQAASSRDNSVKIVVKHTWSLNEIRRLSSLSFFSHLIVVHVRIMTDKLLRNVKEIQSDKIDYVYTTRNDNDGGRNGD